MVGRMSRLQRVGLIGTLVLSSGVGCSAIYAYSPPEGPPRYCTIFNHMVKSAGTSVKDQLYVNSRKDGQARPGGCTGDNLGRAHECMTALHNSSVITGYAELLRSPLKSMGRQCDFFTMMRHPIERLVSAFFYCPTDHDVQVRPKEWCGDAVLDVPATTRLVDFARRTWKNKAATQMMYSFRCPVWADGTCSPIDDAFLDFRFDIPRTGLYTERGRKLMTNLESLLGSYVAVGIADEWELSMQLFDAVVVSPVRKWDVGMMHNSGHVSETRRKVLDWAYESEEIRSIIAADLMLYDLAKGIFKRQTSEILGTVWI